MLSVSVQLDSVGLGSRVEIVFIMRMLVHLNIILVLVFLSNSTLLPFPPVQTSLSLVSSNELRNQYFEKGMAAKQCFMKQKLNPVVQI